MAETTSKTRQHRCSGGCDASGGGGRYLAIALFCGLAVLMITATVLLYKRDSDLEDRIRILEEKLEHVEAAMGPIRPPGGGGGHGHIGPGPTGPGHIAPRVRREVDRLTRELLAARRAAAAASAPLSSSSSPADDFFALSRPLRSTGDCSCPPGQSL